MGNTWEVWGWVASEHTRDGYTWTRLYAGEDFDAANGAFARAKNDPTGPGCVKIEWRRGT